MPAFRTAKVTAKDKPTNSPGPLTTRTCFAFMAWHYRDRLIAFFFLDFHQQFFRFDVFPHPPTVMALQRSLFFQSLSFRFDQRANSFFKVSDFMCIIAVAAPDSIAVQPYWVQLETFAATLNCPFGSPKHPLSILHQMNKMSLLVWWQMGPVHIEMTDVSGIVGWTFFRVVIIDAKSRQRSFLRPSHLGSSGGSARFAHQTLPPLHHISRAVYWRRLSEQS